MSHNAITTSSITQIVPWENSNCSSKLHEIFTPVWRSRNDSITGDDIFTIL